MKKIYNLWMAALVLMIGGACTPEVDDLFEQSAANRIEQTIAEHQQVLRAASNGWVLDYYPSAVKEFGGYTMLIKFHEDGTARVACDLFLADKEATSLYDIKNSAGPMLTFNTYNEIFHFFSEPENALHIGENGYGMEGDADFLIVKCTADEVVLQGKKTGNLMTMKPVPQSVSWNDYLTKVKEITAQAFPAAYDVIVNGQTAYSVKQRYRKFILTNADGSHVELPFHYTDKGISFYSPLAIGSQSVQHLTWDNQQMSYTNGTISIRAQQLPEGYVRYQELKGSYAFVYNGQNSVKNVTLEEELFNESFIMKGFPMDIRVTYLADKGTISILNQTLEDPFNLCVWDMKGEGMISATRGAGMIGNIEKDGEQLIITFADNGVWGKHIADSFIAFNFKAGDAAFQIPYITGMVKLPEQP